MPNFINIHIYIDHLMILYYMYILIKFNISTYIVLTFRISRFLNVYKKLIKFNYIIIYKFDLNPNCACNYTEIKINISYFALYKRFNVINSRATASLLYDRKDVKYHASIKKS